MATTAATRMTHPKLGTAELLFTCAQQMELLPIWLIPRSVFAITVDGQERYINLARSPLNSHASAALAKNKHVTRRILERHNLPNIPFTVAQTQQEAVNFMELHTTIIAKPITGSGAQDIHIITEAVQLSRLTIHKYILEKYIVGQELRFLLLNGAVIGVHRSDYGSSVAADRPLQRISYQRSDWDPELLLMSQRIADILNLKFAAVDYLISPSGQAQILEVNTMPGLKWFHAPSSGPVVDIARLFLESVVDTIRAERDSRRTTIVPSSY